MAVQQKKGISTDRTEEPVTNLRDEGRFYCLTAELPGINEEKIFIDLEKSVLAISATDTGTGKKFRKLIRLPSEVRFGKKKFSDGVLNIILEKNVPEKSG